MNEAGETVRGIIAAVWSFDSGAGRRGLVAYGALQLGRCRSMFSGVCPPTVEVRRRLSASRRMKSNLLASDWKVAERVLARIDAIAIGDRPVDDC
jgi:hypothetical protein